MKLIFLALASVIVLNMGSARAESTNLFAGGSANWYATLNAQAAFYNTSRTDQPQSELSYQSYEDRPTSYNNDEQTLEQLSAQLAELAATLEETDTCGCEN